MTNVVFLLQFGLVLVQLSFRLQHSHVGPINVPSLGAEQRDICLDDLHLRTE